MVPDSGRPRCLIAARDARPWPCAVVAPGPPPASGRPSPLLPPSRPKPAVAAGPASGRAIMIRGRAQPGGPGSPVRGGTEVGAAPARDAPGPAL